MAIIISATPETRAQAFNILIAPGRSCSDKRGTNNKATVFFIHVYLHAICEMIKYFTSLIRGDATCKK